MTDRTELRRLRDTEREELNSPTRRLDAYYYSFNADQPDGQGEHPQGDVGQGAAGHDSPPVSGLGAS